VRSVLLNHAQDHRTVHARLRARTELRHGQTG
jgi:hypothetical protein